MRADVAESSMHAEQAESTRGQALRSMTHDRLMTEQKVVASRML